MQGISAFIPTELKVNYLNALLDCGFDRLDFGSFVSPKAIPQLQDTALVLAELNPSNTDLLAIIANERGMDHALEFERISYLGYPFSVSEQFQQRNTNASNRSCSSSSRRAYSSRKRITS
jgi:hydroxymethylglutaryl-CoA lyase